MGSVTVFIDDKKGYWNSSNSTYAGNGFNLVKVGGQYVKKIELDIVSASHMNHGWDSYQGHDVSFGATRIGKRTLWDYSENGFVKTLKTAKPNPLNLNQVGFSGYEGNSYPKTRDGGNYKIKHQTYSWLSEAYANNVPRPTFRIAMNDSSVIDLTTGVDYSYEEWGDVNTSSPCAQHGITVYKKPYVADQTMTVTSSTTANMYYPENGSQFVILKQPSVYSSIGIVDDTTTMALSGYSSISPLWGSGTSYNFWVKILVYKPDWDSLSDIQMSWNVTGAKASQCSAQSGTITSFADIPNATGGWVNYAVGYFPFTYSIGSSLGASDLNFNVVANGLKFDSGTQTKTVSALG
jgi:hypothetical protein